MDKIITLPLMIVACIIGAFGALYMKKSAANFTLKWKKLFSNLKNKNLMIGLFLYAASTVLFVILLKHNKLMFLYPMTSLTYIFAIILSKMILNERITKYKIIAVILIILGNIFITI